jgi:hypothetical protein
MDPTVEAGGGPIEIAAVSTADFYPVARNSASMLTFSMHMAKLSAHRSPPRWKSPIQPGWSCPGPLWTLSAVAPCNCGAGQKFQVECYPDPKTSLLRYQMPTVPLSLHDELLVRQMRVPFFKRERLSAAA